MTVLSFVSMFGGLALFLYGMEVMGNGLKSFSASALKQALSKVTGNVVVAFLLGFLITCIVQSSTATIVLTVGLLGAGVLELRPSIGIVFGANVGTTITAQIIRLIDVDSSASGGWWLDLLSPQTLAPLGAIAGIILLKFVKKNSLNNVGTILMGFGVLFIGLMNMTSAMDPLSESESFRNMVANISSPGLGFVAGVVVTLIMQSSSASVGILQSLCSTGAMSFSLCFSYVLGAALGTGIVTAIICSIGTKANAKRAVFVHVFYSVFGGVLFMSVILLLRQCGAIGDEYWSHAMTSGNVADFETCFKAVVALLLLPFARLLEKLACRVIKEDATAPVDSRYAEIQENIQALDTHLFLSPAVALDQTAHVIGHMGEVALENLNAAVALIERYDVEERARIEKREELLDRMADSTNNYLVELSPHVQSEADNERLNLMLRAYTEFERIGDLVVNIAEGVESLYERKKHFSETGIAELKLATQAVRETVELAVECFTTAKYDPQVARHVEPLEEVVDDLLLALRNRHIERLKSGSCSVSAGVVFLDLLVNLERISDQCSNLAVDVLSLQDSSIKGNEHEYIAALHAGTDEAYTAEFKQNAEKYLTPLQP